MGRDEKYQYGSKSLKNSLFLPLHFHCRADSTPTLSTFDTNPLSGDTHKNKHEKSTEITRFQCFFTGCREILFALQKGFGVFPLRGKREYSCSFSHSEKEPATNHGFRVRAGGTNHDARSSRGRGVALGLRYQIGRLSSVCTVVTRLPSLPITV